MIRATWPFDSGPAKAFATLPVLGYWPSEPRRSEPRPPSEMAASLEQLPDLIAAHEVRLAGYFRGRVFDSSAREDLCQDTWAEVARRFDTFDSEKGTFWQFTRIWAGFVVRRHWEAQRARSREIPESFLARTGEDEGDRAERESEVTRTVFLEATFTDDQLDLARILVEILRRAFACTRPPHEVLTFGFVKLRWKPAEVVDQLLEDDLRELRVRLQEGYTTIVATPVLSAMFAPLDDRLGRRLGELIDDPRTRERYAGQLDLICGQSRLGEYLPSEGPAAAAITRWWDTVKRTVLSGLRADAGDEILAWGRQV